MHAGEASIARHFLDEVGLVLLPRQTHGEFGDDMPQAVNLLLQSEVADGPARILNVLLAVQNLPDRLRLGSAWIPNVDREHQRIAAMVVVEYRLDRGIGEDAPNRARRRCVPPEMPAAALPKP